MIAIAIIIQKHMHVMTDTINYGNYGNKLH